MPLAPLFTSPLCLPRASRSGHWGLLLVLLLLPALGRLTPLAAQPPAEFQLPQATPESLGFDEARLARIAELVEAGIEAKKMPGCVLCFGRRGQIAWLEAYGNKRLQPNTEPMSVDTVFDMASITKPTATATSIMKLVEMGQLRLSQRVSEFFPEFGTHGKDEITIRHLLIHQSGLIPDNPLGDYLEGPETAWQKICQLKLVAEVGKEFKYSDVNFIVLGKLVEHLSGKNLDEFSQEMIFGPLAMRDTGFVPPAQRQARAAPTEQRDGQWIQGEVHDPRAYRLDGIAGHAGLFSTAQDMALYASMLLDHGTLSQGEQRVSILAPATIERMTAAYPVSSGTRGLGWDKQTGYSSNKGDLLSDRAFGHGGFTGTVLWIDPQLDLFFIFLSNRLHPSGDGSVNGLAGQILNVVAGAIIDPAPALSDSPAAATKATKAGKAGKVNEASSVREPVHTGLDVLLRDAFRPLAGQRVGLITNHTGKARSGESAAELFQRAAEVKLTALFSPEHGFEGKLDVAHIGNAQDAATGLQVYSLYGETRRPTSQMLENVDTLVFDIQDIGARFYTYVSTMGEAMQAAAEHGKRFVVLDRPNPINGLMVAGPMLDSGLESFVGYHHLPVRHGMTAGELAQMFRAELQLELELVVIPCENWQRADYWEATGLTWINPSPNMRSLTQATLYPGVGLLETTNISVGRGTDTPFEIIGAPWLDAQTMAANLQALQLPGVIFIPVTFTPDSSKYANELCQGINFAVIDRQQFDPLQLGLALACQLQQLHPQQWETKSLNRLLGNQNVADAIIAGRPLGEVLELSQLGVSDFLDRRKPFLLY